MSSFSCFCPCFGERGTAASPEATRDDRGSHRGRRSCSFLSRLMRRGRKNARNQDQERVEQEFVNEHPSSNLENSTQEETRNESNATSSPYFEEIDQENQKHVEQTETNEIGALIQDEVEESPTSTHRDREPVIAHPPPNGAIRISLRVRLAIFFFFWLICYNNLQEASVQDLVPLMEESPALKMMVPFDASSPPLVPTPASDLNSSVENGYSWIKCVVILLGVLLVLGLYLIWESMYGAFMLAWCLLSGIGVRDELRFSTRIHWMSMIWRQIEIELERERDGLVKLVGLVYFCE